MNKRKTWRVLLDVALFGLAILVLACPLVRDEEEPVSEAPGPDWVEVATLPSWNDGAARQAIIDFVSQVTTPGTPTFVPKAQRQLKNKIFIKRGVST